MYHMNKFMNLMKLCVMVVFVTLNIYFNNKESYEEILILFELLFSSYMKKVTYNCHFYHF